MKSEKGITLIALVIYIIGLLIVIGLLSMFMKFFYNNVNRNAYADNSSEQYLCLIEYLSTDLNSNDLKLIKLIGDNEEMIYIRFNNSNIIHEYAYNNQNIYYMEGNNTTDTKTIMLCKNVTACNFEIEENILKINVTINEKEYENQFYIKNSNL